MQPAAMLAHDECPGVGTRFARIARHVQNDLEESDCPAAKSPPPSTQFAEGVTDWRPGLREHHAMHKVSTCAQRRGAVCLLC